MALDASAAVATLRGLTAKFDNAVRAATPFYPTVCTVRPSYGRDEQYGLMGNMPGVREWLGDRVFNSLRAAHFTIENRKWESSLAIEKDDIADDRMGMYDMVLADLGVEAAYHPDELWFGLLESNGLCFDGQNFFDTDHSWGSSGTQSNAITKTVSSTTVTNNLSAITGAEFLSAHHMVMSTFVSFKRDNGKSFYRPVVNLDKDILWLIPSAMKVAASQAFDPQFNASLATNVVVGRPNVVVGSHLTSNVVAYAFIVNQPLRPFVFQARDPLARQMKGLDDREFKDVKFMTDARYNVGYLAWWQAIKVTFST